MLNGRTELHIFDRGSVTGGRYCEEVLLPQVRLFQGAIVPDFIFMDGNARPHRTLAVEELLESEDITRMDWPAYSPDINPIEHVWDDLGRRIAARSYHPENTQQLKQMLIEEWALLPQEMSHQLILSIRRRCEATIASKTKLESPYFKNLHKYQSQDVHFQWIPSHVNIFGYEQVDLLAKEGCNASPPISSTLTYSEHQSRVKSEILKEWRTPHNHHWKTFALCTKCKPQQASADHILDCLGLSREDLLSPPLLVSDFLRVNGLLGLV
ncbi:transposable element Tcb2 transposase [Trichonephila clavipes]|nr:transposable element Tcb2 transposase [Trichonephila clavipes]